MLDRTPGPAQRLQKINPRFSETIFREGGTQFREDRPWLGISRKGPMVDRVHFLRAAAGHRRRAARKERLISVFCPARPIPTTGFYFYVPVKDVVELAITPNEAAQLVMSAGLIQPGGQAALAAMAQAAKQAAPIGEAETL